jgi:hypothetical protein
MRVLIVPKHQQTFSGGARSQDLYTSDIVLVEGKKGRNYRVVKNRCGKPGQKIPAAAVKLFAQMCGATSLLTPPGDALNLK